MIKTICSLLFLSWMYIGLCVGLALLDYKVTGINPIPNPNKYKLAVVVLGPCAWIVFIIYFTVVTISPLANKMIKWFFEE